MPPRVSPRMSSGSGRNGPVEHQLDPAMQRDRRRRAARAAPRSRVVGGGNPALARDWRWRCGVRQTPVTPAAPMRVQHLDRLLHGAGTVVHTGQQMTVKIDHAIAAPSAPQPAPRRRPSPAGSLGRRASSARVIRASAASRSSAADRSRGRIASRPASAASTAPRASCSERCRRRAGWREHARARSTQRRGCAGARPGEPVRRRSLRRRAIPPTSPGVAARGVAQAGRIARARPRRSAGRPPPLPPLSAAIRLTRSPALRPALHQIVGQRRRGSRPGPRCRTGPARALRLPSRNRSAIAPELVAVVAAGLGDGDAARRRPRDRLLRSRPRRRRASAPPRAGPPACCRSCQQLLDRRSTCSGCAFERLGRPARSRCLQLADRRVARRGPVTASIRRTPAATPPWPVNRNRPELRRWSATWVPPQSSIDGTHLHHADHVAVLLGEERHRAERQRVGVGHLAGRRPRWLAQTSSLTSRSIALQRGRVDRPVMREVEAQPVRLDQGALLPHVGAETASAARGAPGAWRCGCARCPGGAARRPPRGAASARTPPERPPPTTVPCCVLAHRIDRQRPALAPRRRRCRSPGRPTRRRTDSPCSSSSTRGPSWRKASTSVSASVVS